MRKHESKPGIDWVVIEARVKQGEALAAIARDYNISRQAIQKRSKRDGWLSVNEAVKDARRVARKVTGLPMSVAVQPVQPVAGVQPDGKVQPSVTKPAINVGVQKFNKDTPEVRASILSLISEGVPKTQREIFGSDAGKGGGLAVQINIMRDGDPEVIDVTPAG